MANIYGMQQLERMILNETDANTHKGLLGEKEILLMLQEQLPDDAHVIHNPTLIHYEADILVIEESIGFMFFEVKTWNERFIERFDPNGNIVTKNGQHKPLKQAENYRSELKSTLSAQLNNSITQDPYQMISSVVIFNGISKDQFLHRSEVLNWEEEWKSKFLRKHFFYTKESSRFYYWMMKSKKFKTSRVSDYYSEESLERLIEILIQDNKNPVEQKVHVAVQRKPKVVPSNILQDQQKKLEVSSIPEVKKKSRLSVFVFLLVIAIIPLVYILNNWGYDNESYEWQEDRTIDDPTFLDIKEDQSLEESENAYDYYILVDSQYTKLVETQLYGLSKLNLRLARNEIYARHGYVFESQDLQKYFTSQSWYVPDTLYNYELTDIEQYNVTLIQSIE